MQAYHEIFGADIGGGTKKHAASSFDRGSTPVRGRGAPALRELSLTSFEPRGYGPLGFLRSSENWQQRGTPEFSRVSLVFDGLSHGRNAEFSRKSAPFIP
jgi:hypothetical protein